MSERLEELINELPYSIRHEGSVETLIKYSKEQAERVEELEQYTDNAVYGFNEVYRQERKYAQKLEQQNKRYREARKKIEERYDIQNETYMGGIGDGLMIAMNNI